MTVEDILQRYIKADPLERVKIVAEILEKKKTQRLTWQERRFLKKTIFDGKPLTPSDGSTGNLRDWKEREAFRKQQIRLKQTYTEEQLDMMAKLVDRALYKHPFMPEKRAWKWAEQKISSGEVPESI